VDTVPSPDSIDPQTARRPASLRSRRLTRAAILVFIATRLVILCAVEAPFSDVWYYFHYAEDAVDLQRTPYHDNFQIEYPPLAWWAMYAPRLLDARRVANVRNEAALAPVYDSYRAAFRGMMACADLLSFLAMLSIAGRKSPSLVGWAAIAYTLPTALLWNLLYDRLDAGLMLFLCAWALCFTRSLDERRSTIAWAAASYLALGAGIAFKVVPIICVPILLLADLLDRRRVARMTTGLPALLVGAGVPFAAQYAMSGMGVFALFGRHAGRGIQLDSSYGTVMLIGSWLGQANAVSQADGAFNLSGPLASALKVVASVMVLTLLLSALTLLLRSNGGRRLSYRLSCWVIAAAVIISNVFSPQYLVWALPVLVLLALEILASRPTARWTLASALVALAATTTWIFPYNYFFGATDHPSRYGIVPLPLNGALAPSAVGYVVLGARNLLYLVVVGWLGMILLRSVSPAADVDPPGVPRA